MERRRLGLSPVRRTGSWPAGRGANGVDRSGSSYDGSPAGLPAPSDGVSLHTDGTRLIVDAPRGVITSDLREQMTLPKARYPLGA